MLILSSEPKDRIHNTKLINSHELLPLHIASNFSQSIVQKNKKFSQSKEGKQKTLTSNID